MLVLAMEFSRGSAEGARSASSPKQREAGAGPA